MQMHVSMPEKRFEISGRVMQVATRSYLSMLPLEIKRRFVTFRSYDVCRISNLHRFLTKTLSVACVYGSDNKTDGKRKKFAGGFRHGGADGAAAVPLPGVVV
jgi:hypothetical protein